MSLVYINYHNEIVLDFENESEISEPLKFKYNSKFRDAIQREALQVQTMEAPDGRKLLAASGKHGHRTMGYAQTPLNAPKQFLRKHQGVKFLRLHDHNCPKEHYLPPVPRRSTTASKSATTKSNAARCIDFVASNIDSVSHMQVKHLLPRLVDTANGDRQNLVEAGLLPKYVYGRSFGKVPRYLRVRKQLAQKMGDAIKANQSKSSEAAVGQITARERSSLLEGLKANYIEQSRLFHRLSLFTDTLAKKMRKTRIENTLKQLEQDIYLMEKNPVIYVSKY